MERNWHLEAARKIRVLAFQRLDKALSRLGAKLADTVWAQFYPLSSKAVGSIRKVEFEFFDKNKAAINKPLVFEGLPSMDAQFGLEVVATSKIVILRLRLHRQFSCRGSGRFR